MGRGGLSGAEWELIGPLLPAERGRWARPAGDNRRFLNGMLHVLRVGCPWRGSEAVQSTPARALRRVGLGLCQVSALGRTGRLGCAAANAG